MKKVTKIIAVLMCIAMLASMCALIVSAEDVEAAKEPYKLETYQIVVLCVGAVIVAFCIYKFVSGRKKLKAKQAAAEQKAKEAETADEEDIY